MNRISIFVTIIGICFLILFASCGCSESSSGKNISPTIGNTVHEMDKAIMVIYQDKKNNYWFGSRGQGTYKYDGKSLIQFTTDHGLISNEIWGIQEDKSGNIYFDTQAGVSRFDGQAFKTLHVSDSSYEWKNIGADDLWFKGNWDHNGAYHYDGKNLHLLKFPESEMADAMIKNNSRMTWSPFGIYSIYRDRKGNIWFGTSNMGIYRFNFHSKSISPGWMYEDHLTSISNGGSFGIRSMFEDSKGSYWFCNTTYRYKIEDEDSSANEKHLIRFKREKGIDNVNADDGKDLIYFLSITEDDNRSLWMVTYNEGVWQYDLSAEQGAGKKKIIQHRIKNGPKVITLYSIYKDNQGILWIGTHEEGAYRFNGSTFEKFSL